MAKAPDEPDAPQEPERGRRQAPGRKPGRDPAKHSKKDPARPTRAKASRPDLPPTDPALAELLNPGIGQGTAGPGSQTGLKPPADNSFDRRADFSAAHRARKSTGLRRGAAGGLWSRTLGRDRRRAWTPSSRRRSVSKATTRPDAGTADKNAITTFRGITGASSTVQALETLLREGRPEFGERPWTPHRPPRPEKSEGGRPLVIQSDFEPKGDQPHRDRRPGGRRQAPGSHPGAARRHRVRQDLHHGQGDRGDPAPGARARAQQDAGGPALRRVQELLPGQRGRIFRQLLRLLPARGLRAAHRHLYREGILDQRADRPHAPQRDARLARARRRHHRGVGVVHLRHRLGRDLFGDDVHPQAGRAHRPAPAHRRSGGAAVQAQRRRLLSRRVPRARRRGRDLSRPLRGPRLARAAVRR